MEFKPKLFIGSSKEGEAVARQIAEELENIAECELWTEIFDLGISNYDNLISQIAFYDYAILIATADDTTISRNVSFNTARDNILFEFGLFAGGLGRSKVLFVVEKGVKIPSDLSGLTLPFIPRRSESNFEEMLLGTIGQIKRHITDRENTYELGLLPSTVMAYGYFNNFVEKTVVGLLQNRADGKPISLGTDKALIIEELIFTILIPTDLREDMFNKVSAKRLRDGWQKVKVSAEGVRDYDFSVDMANADGKCLSLIDIPLTLNALNLAIDLYSGKQHLGTTVKESLLEYREIRNFKRTLEYLIGKSSFTKGIVHVEMVNI